jgi:hypothetical protein
MSGYSQKSEKKIKSISYKDIEYTVFTFYKNGNLKEAYTKSDSTSKINNTYYLFNQDGQLIEENIYMNKSIYYSYNKDHYVTNCYRVKNGYDSDKEKYIADTTSHTVYLYNADNKLTKELQFYRKENGKLDYKDTGLITKYTYISKNLINCTSIENRKVKTENGNKMVREETYLFKYHLTYNKKNQISKAELFFGNDSKGSPYFIFDYDSTGRKAKINTIRHGKRTKLYRYDFINIPFCTDALSTGDPQFQEYLLYNYYKRLFQNKNVKIIYQYY